MIRCALVPLSVAVTSSVYVPARRHPVWPGVSESASFCAVRQGFADVPAPVVSDPVVAETRSQVTAPCAAGAAYARLGGERQHDQHDRPENGAHEPLPLHK